MNDHYRLASLSRLAGMAVLTAILSSIASPAFASTPSPSSPFSAAAVAKVVKESPVPVATATTPVAAPQANGSFIKSRTGVMIVAIFAVGTGYALYSLREDRIRGLNR